MWKKKNSYWYSSRPIYRQYLDKEKGRYITTYEKGAISSKELRNGIVKLSGTDIRIETKVKNINQCRIIPKNSHYVIEIVYTIKELDMLYSISTAYTEKGRKKMLQEIII